MKTIKISHGLHFRDIVKILKYDLKDESLLFLLPDVPSIVQAEEVFLEQGGIWGERILTFGKLAHIANLNSQIPKNYISRTGRLLLMEEILQNVSKEFNYFNEIYNIRDFSDSVLRVIAELKHCGLTQHSFVNLISPIMHDVIHSKMQDLSKVYNQYSFYLESNGYIDDIDSLRQLSDFLQEGLLNRIIPGVKQIVFYGYNEFTDSQDKVIDALGSNGVKVDILLYEKDAPVINDRITVHEFQSRTEEVQYCAKEIGRLLTVESVNPAQIVVINNSSNEYSTIIDSEFNKLGIGYSQSPILSLISSSIGKLITDLLLLKISGFKKQYLFNILRNLYILELSKDPIVMHKEVALYELQSLKNRVVQGIDGWKGLLQNDSNTYSREFKGLLNTILNLINKKFTSKKIYSLNKDLTGVLDELVYERIRNHNYLENNAEYNAEYNALVSSFNVIKEYNYIIQKVFKDRYVKNLTDYLKLISDLLSEERYSMTSEHSDDRIKVLNFLEARGTVFEYIFVLGAGENEMPKPVRHDPIIKDHERYLLNKEFNMNMLKTRNEILNTEAELVNIILNSGKKTKISFVNLDSKGLSVQPSYLIEEYCNKNINTTTEVSSNPDEQITAHITELELFNNIFSSKLYADSEFKNRLPVDYKYTVRGIFSESQRCKRLSSLSEYEGLVSPDPGLADKNTFTVTDLETYGDCPFKYYASKILKLEYPEESIDELQPLDLGSLYHQIIYKFLYELSIQQNGKIDLSNISDDEIIASLKICLESLNLKNEFNWLSNHRKELIIKRIKNNVIPSFVLNESVRIRQNNSKGIYPEFFEKDLTYTVEDSLVVKGKSDRIDTSSDQALVIDYKFGGVNSRKFSDYRNLQLPLYLLALNMLNYDSYGGYYRSVEKPDQQKGMDSKSNNFEDEIYKASHYAQMYIKNIKAGHYPADPGEKKYQNGDKYTEIKKISKAPCIYCEFKDLCRANQRVFRKNIYGS